MLAIQVLQATVRWVNGSIRFVGRTSGGLVVGPDVDRVKNGGKDEFDPNVPKHYW